MKNIFTLFFIIVILTLTVNAQDTTGILDSLKQQFETFQFTRVISSADSLLLNKALMSKKQLIEIYKIKAVSEFSLLEEENAKRSFTSILNLDNNFQFDSTKTSPKIISFFDELKNNYLTGLETQKKLQVQQDTLFISQTIEGRTAEENFRNAMVRSLLLPGMGHLYAGEKTKGIILTSLSAVSLSSMIYFIFDANKKQDDYQSETDPNLIAVKYNDYNNSFKLRNVSIITFAVLWIYSQIDILFATDFSEKENITFSKMPQLKYNALRGIQFSYKFSL